MQINLTFKVYHERIYQVSVNCAKEAAKRHVKAFVAVSTAEIYDADQVKTRSKLIALTRTANKTKLPMVFDRVHPLRSLKSTLGLRSASTNTKQSRHCSKLRGKSLCQDETRER